MIRQRTAPYRDLSLLFGKVFPALRALVRTGYFSLSVEGTEHIPKHGPVIYAGNHAGWFTLDAFLSALAMLDAVGPDRLPYAAVQDQLLQVPCVGRFFEHVGGFPASWLRDPRTIPSEMQVFTVYPEGTEGNCKPFWRAYQMREWRTGFARIAAARGALVVPMAAIGGEECLPVALTIRLLKPILGTILPLPLCPLPLPARWKFVFHEPVDIAALDSRRSGAAPLSQRRRYRRFADTIRSTVQATLDRETADHRLARLSRFLGRRQRAPWTGLCHELHHSA